MKSRWKFGAVLVTAALIFGGGAPAYAEEAAPGDETLTGGESTAEQTQLPGEDGQGETPAPEGETPAPEGETPDANGEAPSAADAPLAEPGTEVAEDDAPRMESATTESEGEAPTSPGLANGQRNIRLSGIDRYATAVEISKHAYPGVTGGVVIVATGTNFPDSLSATPLAAKLSAPLLLTKPEALPAVVKTELQRLRPKTILVIGSTGAVSAAVFSELTPLASQTITRLEGENRYETSARIAQYGWPSGASNAFIATGTGFADALSAGAAAKKINGPVLLVPGPLAVAPVSIKARLTNAAKLYIAGGTSAVSNEMVSSLLAGSARTTVRYAGTGRYDTSARIANAHFSGSLSASYWASGTGFADALAGAAVAGAKSVPLLLSQPDCVPTPIYDANDRLRPTNTYLLGGPAALQDTVLYGNECVSAAPGMTGGDLAGTSAIYAAINQHRYGQGIQGARFAGSQVSYSAFAWSQTMQSSNWLRLNPSLASWVNEEYVLKNPTASHADPVASFNYMRTNAPEVLNFNVSGQRVWAGVGWLDRAGTSWMTVYTGIR